jgi:hypothetical protein
MFRHLVSGGALLLALVAAKPALAEIIAEPFNTVDGYNPGSPLSDNYWTQADDTAGVLDIEDVGGVHGNVVKLTLDGPDPGPGFPTISATTETGWGGPQRDNHQLWVSVDIEKGTGDGNTSLGSNIWNLQFAKANGAELFMLQGGLGTVRLRSIGTATSTPSVPTPTFNLNDGWNQVAVFSDLSVGANPNTILYLNGTQVASLQVDLDSGPFGIESAANVPNIVTLTRIGRGGTGDNLVGMMRFDNVTTANENILVPEPSASILASLGLLSLLFVRRRWRA